MIEEFSKITKKGNCFFPLRELKKAKSLSVQRISLLGNQIISNKNFISFLGFSSADWENQIETRSRFLVAHWKRKTSRKKKNSEKKSSKKNTKKSQKCQKCQNSGSIQKWFFRKRKYVVKVENSFPKCQTCHISELFSENFTLFEFS